MNDNVIFDRIKNIISEIVTENSLMPVDIEINLNEFINSVDFVYMIVKLENEFNIEIPDKYLVSENLNSIKEIENVVEGLLKKEDTIGT